MNGATATGMRWLSRIYINRITVLDSSVIIGGIIGTGLFLGTTSALMNGSHVGLLLGYMFIGSPYVTVLWLVNCMTFTTFTSSFFLDYYRRGDLLSPSCRLTYQARRTLC